MLTTEDLGRLADLTGQAKAVLVGSEAAAADPDGARRRVVGLLAEAIRICETDGQVLASTNGRPPVD